MAEVAGSNKLVDITGTNEADIKVNDPFEMAMPAKVNANQMSGAEEEAAREKLRQMGNRKAISSEDF